MSTEKIEKVILIAERLIAALEADIAALERGMPQAMRTIDPEVQKLTLLYAREASALIPALAKNAPDALRTRLTATTQHFREVLLKHARILTRVRSASEGMIQTVAQEVERRRAVGRPYGPATRARPAGAMVFNAVT